MASFTRARLDIFRAAIGSENDDLVKHLETSSHQNVAQALDACPHSVTEECASKLKLADIVADATGEDVPLSSIIVNDPQTTSTRHLALNYGLARIQQVALQASTTPRAAFVQGEDFPAAVLSKALKYRRRIFEMEPTAVLQQMISSGTDDANPSDALLVHSDRRICSLVAKFLDERPSFNIRTQSILKEIKPAKQNVAGGCVESLDDETRQQVFESLKVLQRVQALTPVPEAIAPLLAANLSSALRVSSVPRPKFAKLMAPKITASTGMSMEEANGLAHIIHNHATLSRARADSALVQLHQTLKGSGLLSIDGLTTMKERKSIFSSVADKVSDSEGIVDLDDLFQDMDFCQCDACQDVTSPTAYYVDLLQYLRNNNLDTKDEWPNTGEEDYRDTVLEKLFIRRPDLQHLRLTCDNANTVLPYIDLSNEVMESFVIHLEDYSEDWSPSKQVVLETWNIEGEDTTELLASPQNTRKPAYCILKEATFPIASLPYFQPLDAMRLYLQHFGISRYELIDVFRLAARKWRVPSSLVTPDKKQLFADLRSQLQERAVTAEYLGMSPEEYVIVSRESIWPIGCSVFADNGVLLTPEQYRASIGVKPPEAYWGYGSASEMMSDDSSVRSGLTWVKAQFLNRAGLSYAATAELVRTYYVNPMFPAGRDKVILDAIQFSYRFLQRLASIQPDQAQGLDAITNFLFWTQPWVHLVELLQEPPTGNPLKKPKPQVKLSRKEIKRWVSRWFGCIGKLVVLESGQGPRFPMKGYIIHYPQSGEHRLKEDDTSASMIRALTDGMVPASSADQTKPTIVGYLDNSGEIHDLQNKLVGYIDMDGRVLYRDWKPIRRHYPTGILLVVDVPKDSITQPGGPTKDETDTPLVSAQIQLDSYMYISRLRLQWIIPAQTCSIENTRLLHLNGSSLEAWEYDRINRFIRLYTKLQPDSWTITDLDACLKGLWKVPEAPPSGSPVDPLTPTNSEDDFSFSKYKDKGCGCSDDDSGGETDDECDDQGPSPCDPGNFVNISPGFLNELKAVKELLRITGLQDKLFALWADIGTFGETSLYAKIFVKNNLRSIDPVFEPDDDGNYLTSQPKIKDHIPVLLAALNVKSNLFDALLRRTGLTNEDIITIPSLSKLYRVSLLPKVLGMSLANLLDALDLFTNPFASASRTLQIYNLWLRISSKGLSIKQLRYLILDVDDPLRPIGPKPLSVLRSTKTILDGLQAIDTANADYSAEQEMMLTAAEVKSKAAQLFAPAVLEVIVGLIEGTALYTTNCAAGLAVDRSKISDKILYKDAETPGDRRATLSVKGVLTEDEESAAVSLFPSNASWAAALSRLRKQAENRAKTTLAPVYPDNIGGAVAVLAKGDVAATPPASDAERGNPGSAPEKRAFFIKAFMRFLRSQLSTQLITTVMSGVSSGTPEMTALLLNSIIQVADGDKITSAMEVLKAIPKHLASPSPGNWTGYLLPKFTDKFAFYGYGETRPPPLMLDGQQITFSHQNEDPSDLWWSDPVSLTGGKLYSLSVVGQTVPGGLQWRTDRGGLVSIPASSLIPGASVGEVTEVFKRLLKASTVIQTFSLEVTEVDYLQTHSTDFEGINFNAMTFGALQRLLSYAEMRDSLVRREVTLTGLFQLSVQNSTATLEQLSTWISQATAWDKATILTLIDPKNFDFSNAAAFRNEIAIAKLSKAIDLIQKTGVRDVSLLLSWTDLKLDFNPTWSIAKSMRHTIRERYSLEDYVQAIKPSHDQLRKNQRDALIAYLLVQPCLQKWGVEDANGLFEFFLLDVQMSSCMQTSRLKQAISSVQQFVQRCMLGLEERSDPKVNVPNDALDATRWQWMSKQTIWTANRKVFLYPENWLVPSLRDAKTPIYIAMEGEMLQRDLNPPNILQSFKDYVSDLDQISHLRAVGLHIEETGPQRYTLHCVGMTPGSPFLFFYRTYNSFVQEWTPWSQIETDIPTYTQEYLMTRGGGEFPPVTAEVLTGCYITPYIWNGRRILFVGQISQKTIANEGALSSEFGQLTKPDSRTRANDMAPKQCWEVKLAYTELRSGRWCQKQVSADSILTPENINLSPSDAFQFLPQSVTTDGGDQYISVEVWQCHQDPLNSNAPTDVGTFIGQFIFDGSLIYKGEKLYSSKPEGWIATNFHLLNGRSSGPTMSSLQLNGDYTLPYFNKAPFVKYSIASDETATLDRQGVVHYSSTSTDLFFHPFTNNLLRAANRSLDNIGPIIGVFNKPGSLSTAIAEGAFGVKSREVGSDGASYPTYSELSRPYSNYNWELGFHAPMQVAQNLMTSQQFDSALDMMHYVFNPYADGPDAKRVWQWPPFKNANSAKVLETILNSLKPREFDQRITQWRDNPFRPHVVARGRIVAYMKWTVMTYIKTLIAYGDYYFRRRTLEDLPRAIQLYVVASNMYGKKGEEIPPQGKRKPQTYFSLLNKWDAFSNASVELELMFPYSNQTPFPWGVTQDTLSSGLPDVEDIALANIFGFATSSYFCLPTNPDLQALRTTIDTRLYNIRNCLDIDGKPMPLALWEPPIDPGQLVQAVASGLSLASALNDLNVALPNYRFAWLLAKAFEVCGELKNLEGNFLSIKEKRDGEALQLLRSTHEITMGERAMEMKKAQLKEALATVDTLLASQESPRYRFQFFSSLAGADVQTLGSERFKPLDLAIEAPSADGDLHLTSAEKEEGEQAKSAQFWNQMASGHEVIAGILHSVPSFNIHTTPMGCGVEVAWGMPNIASSLQAKARVAQMVASRHSFKSTEASRKAANIRQYQDRVQQMNLAGHEFEHINAQIAAQKVRIQLANMDINNQQKVLDNSKEVDEFLRNKYTNDELYTYLESSTRQNMYQTYQLAFDLAKKAELAYRFERKATGQPNFISFGYYDPGRDGLQSGQQLYLALKRMEASYQAERGHDYELTKTISLRQLNPYALLTLRETGSCQIDLPEVLFDMDFPGHYFRRLKTVSLTIPCVVGPYVGINATLRLLSHRYRWNPISTGSGQDYLEKMEGKLDDRFKTDFVPIDAIAASTGQNDSGVFELSIRDERYLPFEGAGAVGNWLLQLPSFPQFDYQSITDVMLTIRYTASDGGALLRKAAMDNLAKYVSTIEGYSQSQGLLTLFDLRSDFASEWAKMSMPLPGAPAEATSRTLVLRDLATRLPAFTRGRPPASVRATDLAIITTLPLRLEDLSINLSYVPPRGPDGEEGGEEVTFDSGPTKIGKNVNMYRVNETDSVLGTWALKIALPDDAKIDSSTRMWMIVRYKMR